ncbi:MAG: sulfite exporter TauE/SafE family protein [Melioribacteraceae bacterium]|nr:sulfite exporter TauE/SafE family protein [Melioribacteraceae bacterium]MCF8355079.1 sulfite exporter TauE/SafE family protein [Melioribacteraceae bacterium]MCF8395672.1 sulfite exporter TauE/SafE family protein [Melioribacteraceae bacterium]MCF8420297.1 sulfite exporter TauE/SafE family protein [Melioribacteraceae bacterium]
MESTFYIVALIIFIASFSQGFSGFGFALISIPFISLLVDVKYAVPLGALCAIVTNVYLLIQLRIHINFKEILNLIIGSTIAIPLGVFFLSQADSSLIKPLLGVIVILFALFSSFKIVEQKGIGYNWGYLFGFASGLLGGAFNTNGPPILIYFYLHGWDKLKLKASITGFFVFSTAIIVASHFAMGTITGEIFFDFLYLIPVVLLGLFTGSKLFNKVSTESYNKLILAALIIIGVVLIFN